MSYPARPIEERLYEQTRRGETTEDCWLWLGRPRPNGYGNLGRGGRGGRVILAHRAAYEIHVGVIPEGLTIDHLCRVRACVNPWHLEPVPGVVNLKRGQAPSAINARKTHCLRGHAFDEVNTYWRPKGRDCKECYKVRRKANGQ